MSRGERERTIASFDWEQQTVLPRRRHHGQHASWCAIRTLAQLQIEESMSSSAYLPRLRLFLLAAEEGSVLAFALATLFCGLPQLATPLLRP
ncbi:hypothetical protein NUW54_g2048 [Trametes sanguinea]|uniref:Uncharacterized protein n=1 Tax=Trametes sanguinea TaxID=158606 RepID=A0ACC1Q4N4_9APHY|nr:hypothetical protein NUW54_g2048 [Trametes sanguinea]